jgi:3-oxoacyl-[acyl-carrier protein] reductase
MPENLFDLTDKVVFVTGGAGGIGAAIAAGFSAAGAKVYAADRALDAVTATAERLAKEGTPVTPVELDITDAEAASTIFDSIIAEHGRIDVLVNNAGIKSDQSALEGDLDIWHRTQRINSDSILVLSRLVIAKSMRERGGRIINTGSSASSRAAIFNYQAGGADYCFSKSLVHAYTQLLAYEGAPLNVLVNAIAPGIVDTPLHGRPSEETEARHAGRIPLGRVGQPHDFVGPALFLASEGSGYVTGQILHVNGGMVMEP